MRVLKFICVIGDFLIFLMVASGVHLFITFLKPSRRWHVMSHLSCLLIKSLQKILGIKMRVKGCVGALREKGRFIISRHVSYIDGLILGGLLPAILLSKKEVKDWPLFGPVVAISGTVFVDRANKNKISDCLEKMMNLLRQKINVVVFPEGTSTNGQKIKPFQTAFFEVPLATQAAIVPVSISYLRLDGAKVDSANQDSIYWYGQVSFFEHLWNLFRFKAIEAEVTIHEKIETAAFSDDSAARKRLSQICFTLISEAAGIKDDSINDSANDDSNFTVALKAK